jgi:hypothetical protein
VLLSIDTHQVLPIVHEQTLFHFFRRFMNTVSRILLLLVVLVGSSVLSSKTGFAQQMSNAQTTITSFAPTSATAGTVVVIRGTNFTGITGVRFGISSTASLAAKSYVVDSPTQITAIVGTGATGSVFVITARGSALRTGFTFVVPPPPAPIVPIVPIVPTITSFTPTSATSGTSIVITGTGFRNVQTVKFGGVDAKSFTVNSTTSITAVVGTGASGAVTVTTMTGTVSKAGFTILLPPSITNLVPSFGTAGTSVVIVGKDFTNVRAVVFGTGANARTAQSFTVHSESRITAVVPSGIANGLTNVSVITDAGFGHAGRLCRVQPAQH